LTRSDVCCKTLSGRGSTRSRAGPVAQRTLNIGRRTIRRWIAEGETNRDVDVADIGYTARFEWQSKLDAYKPLIEEQLSQYPELTAVTLYAEVHAAGYTGGMSRLRALVRRTRPKVIVDPVVRYGTRCGRTSCVAGQPG